MKIRQNITMEYRQAKYLEDEIKLGRWSSTSHAFRWLVENDRMLKIAAAQEKEKKKTKGV